MRTKERPLISPYWEPVIRSGCPLCGSCNLVQADNVLDGVYRCGGCGRCDDPGCGETFRFSDPDYMLDDLIIAGRAHKLARRLTAALGSGGR